MVSSCSSSTCTLLFLSSRSSSSFASCRGLSPFLLLCLFALFSSLSCGCAQPTSLSAVSILYVTGCTDTYPTTVNCSSPANLTVWTSGLGSLLPTRLFVETAIAGSIIDCRLNPEDPSNSSVTATVSAVTWDSTWIGSLINIFLFSFSEGQTPSFAGFSFAYEPPPTLTSISGCTGSGAATLNCAPDTSVLTLQGSGLRWVARSSWWQLIIGQQGIRASATIVNDSYIVQPLSGVYYGIVLAENYNSGPLPLYFKNVFSGSRVGVTQTNALSISFIPLPPPSVTAVSVTGCNQSSAAGGSTTWSGCRAGASTLTLSGYYLYAAQVTVGGQDCVYSSAQVNSITCYVPLTSAFLPGVAYDVEVWNDNGRITLPALLSFSSAPSLSYILPCYPSTQYSYYSSIYSVTNLLCPPSSTLTLMGANLSPDPAVLVVLTTNPSVYSSVKPVSMNCLQAAVLNSSALSCVLPVISNATLAEQVYRQPMVVQLFFPASNQQSNALIKNVFAPPSLPIVSSVSSADCSSSVAALQLAGCAPGATLTVTGASLTGSSPSANAYAALTPTSNSQFLATVQLINDTALLLVLPLNYSWQDVELQDGLLYTMYLTLWVNNTPQPSTAFYVSFTLPTTASATTASSSPVLSSGAIAGIVVALLMLAVLLLSLALWRCRRRVPASPKDDDGFSSSVRPNQGGPASDSSEEMTGVEMH